MEKRSYNNEKGMVMIPDISGFSDFVVNTNIFIGQYITESLLKSIIESNQLCMEVSEIEGDAVLFYKYNDLPAFEEIIFQIEEMYSNFKTTLASLSKQLALDIKLSLKIIVHYGQFSRYKIGNFEKLYGAPIVEAYSMLKNRIAKFPPYALFSDTFLKANFESPGEMTLAYDNCTYLSEIGYIHYL